MRTKEILFIIINKTNLNNKTIFNAVKNNPRSSNFFSSWFHLSKLFRKLTTKTTEKRNGMEKGGKGEKREKG